MSDSLIAMRAHYTMNEKSLLALVAITTLVSVSNAAELKTAVPIDPIRSRQSIRKLCSIA
jgi:hypothetical protein